MRNEIRGLECKLDSYQNQIGELLQFLAKENYTYYMPWCLHSDHQELIYPSCTPIPRKELLKLSKAIIWELVIYIYPFRRASQPFETYADFVKSPCIGVLLYYDCGYVEFYAKNDAFRQAILEKLVSLGAESMMQKTSENDGRLFLHL